MLICHTSCLIQNLEPLEVSRLHYFHVRNSTPQQWLPSCLDLSLYCDKRLFDYLRPHRKCQNLSGTVTRAGIFSAMLNGGNDALDRYLNSKFRSPQGVLELLLAEQCFLDTGFFPPHRVNTRLARLLIGYGVSINSRIVQDFGGVNLLLRLVVHSAKTFGYDEDLQSILI